MKNLKENKGITMIALIVTIIVLLIIAGVSITLVIGDKGIIKQAEDSAKKVKTEQNNTVNEFKGLEQDINSRR